MLEPLRVVLLGDTEGGGSRMARPGPFSWHSAPRLLALGPVLARALGTLAPELLLADCGALRTRVIELSRGRAVVRSLENARCTAGAGRFVETMAAALRVSLTEVDARVAEAKDPCKVSSPCPVFAESEVVSQVNAGRAREDILSGVVAHAVEKLATLVERARPNGRPLLAIGGLARLDAFRSGLVAKLPGVEMLAAPVDAMLLPCLAGLAQVTEARPGSWPEIELLRWSARDAA
jgi:hypothetical protein